MSTEVKEEIVKEEIQLDDSVITKLADVLETRMQKKSIAEDKVEAKNKTEVKEVKNEKAGNVLTRKSFNESMHAKKFKTLNVITKGLMTTSDDKVSDTIPAEDFVAEVARLEKEYGVAMRDANIIRTDNETVTLLKHATEITVEEISEAADFPNDELSIQKVTGTVKKYGGYVLFTNEMVEDAAVDLFAEATREYGRAFARKKDEIVFTDSTTGLLNVAGTNEVLTGPNFDDISYNDLVDAINGITDAATPGAKFYMHRTAWALIQKIVDGDDRPLVNYPGIGNAAERQLLGYPVELVEVMPTASDDSLDTAFIVFGNLSRYDLLIRNEMEMKVLVEGRLTIGGTDYDLGHQDLTALRAKQRFGGVVRFADAFSVIKTAASS